MHDRLVIGMFEAMIATRYTGDLAAAKYLVLHCFHRALCCHGAIQLSFGQKSLPSRLVTQHMPDSVSVSVPCLDH